MDRFEPGRVVVRRDRWWGRTMWATAVIVVRDEPGLFVTYAPPRSESMVIEGENVIGSIAAVAARSWTLARTERYNHTLAIHEPGEAFTVMVLWDDAWRPLCWYVNAEEPHVRTARTYDTQDHQLDVVMSVDRMQWRWKDEDHLDAARAAGLYDDAQAASIRSACVRAVERLHAVASPYGPEWLEWRPDPSWPVPTLPDRWDD